MKMDIDASVELKTEVIDGKVHLTQIFNAEQTEFLLKRNNQIRAAAERAIMENNMNRKKVDVELPGRLEKLRKDMELLEMLKLKIGLDDSTKVLEKQKEDAEKLIEVLMPAMKGLNEKK